MNRYYEKLLDKYINKQAESIFSKVFDENFDRIFNEKCKCKFSGDTTLGETFREIQKILVKELSKIITQSFDDLYVGNKISENPYRDLVLCLIDNFEQNLDLNYFVNDIIDDKWNETQKQLFELGIVDIEGDYIQQQKIMEA